MDHKTVKFIDLQVLDCAAPKTTAKSFLMQLFEADGWKSPNHTVDGLAFEALQRERLREGDRSLDLYPAVVKALHVNDEDSRTFLNGESFLRVTLFVTVAAKVLIVLNHELSATVAIQTLFKGDRLLNLIF